MNLRKEVRDLISVNEGIQSTLVQGERMTLDEAHSAGAAELLKTVHAPTSDRADMDGRLGEKSYSDSSF